MPLQSYRSETSGVGNIEPRQDNPSRFGAAIRVCVSFSLSCPFRIKSNSQSGAELPQNCVHLHMHSIIYWALGQLFNFLLDWWLCHKNCSLAGSVPCFSDGPIVSTTLELGEARRIVLSGNNSVIGCACCSLF